MQVPEEAFAGPQREVLSFSSQLAAAGEGRCEVTWPALRAAGAGFCLTEKDAVRCGHTCAGLQQRIAQRLLFYGSGDCLSLQAAS